MTKWSLVIISAVIIIAISKDFAKKDKITKALIALWAIATIVLALLNLLEAIL